MSTIAVNAITDANDGNTTTINGVTPNSANVVGKNRIINGNMAIDQRNAGASITPTAGVYALDRWAASINVASKFSLQQNAGSVTPPEGFSKYLGITSLSAYTLASGEFCTLTQYIEGSNVDDLNWGTSNAKAVTLSFWVRSSLTGTFGGAFNNSDSSRSYPFTYSISSANTWEKKSITIAGDTTGTWLTTNGRGIVVRLGFGSGSTYSGTAGSWSGSTYFTATGATSVVATSGATFYITGVQLEAGSSATEFEHRQYGTELQLCQRYYQDFANALGVSLMATKYTPNNGHWLTLVFNPRLRASPTITSSSWAAVQPSVFGSNSVAVTFNHASTSFHCQASTVVNASAEL